MHKCICGREFQNVRGIRAHQFYCDSYVNSLSYEAKANILQRKEEKKNAKSAKDSAKLAEFLKEGRMCKLCGNPITRIDKTAQYCSKHCSAIANYANRSIETRERALRMNGDSHRKIAEQKRNARNAQYAKENHHCEECGQRMIVKYASGRFCSKECSIRYCANYGRIHREEASARTKASWQNPQIRKKYLDGQQKAIDAGRWPSMMQSNTPSYPEQYWMNVLDNAKISYEYNYLIRHSELGVTEGKLTWYKLDFYLRDYNVDLEIDGSQHQEQVDHDMLRDTRLENSGYKVYRIPWKGHWAVNQQLQDLLDYLASI